jgi:hypothetical protein
MRRGGNTQGITATAGSNVSPESTSTVFVDDIFHNTTVSVTE